MIRSDHNISTLLDSVNNDNIKYNRKKCQPFIFTKMPRTASTSISLELKKEVKGMINVGRFKKLDELLNNNKINLNDFNFNLNHMRIQAAALKFKNKNFINLLENRFCFFFVRNPWDRMISLWRLFVCNDIPNAVNKNGIYFGLSFNDFVYKFFDDKRSDKENEYRVLTGLNRQLGDSQWRWGHQWLNFIGRYENLQNDFNEIEKILQINQKKITNKSKRYKSTKENSKKYQYFYNDKLIEVVGEHYKIDCQLFGYTFESITKNSNDIKKDLIDYINKIMKKNNIDIFNKKLK